MFTFDVDAAIGNDAPLVANPANSANPITGNSAISNISKISNPIPPLSKDAGPIQEQAITPAERFELRGLVDAVATFNDFTQEQTAEAQEIAQADPVAALECFRELASKIPVSDASDDRIKCTQCSNLVGGVCTKWNQLGAVRGYQPVLIPRRCIQFTPDISEPDQRCGFDRWRGLT